MQQTQSPKAGERTQVQVGILNPSIWAHEQRYTQHICPRCLKANGENETGVIVQCPECETEYRVPRGVKFALGPWRIDAETVNHPPIIAARDGKGRDIAVIHGDSKEERAATARLVAASPKMAMFIRELYDATDIQRTLNASIIRQMQDLLTEAGLTK